MAANVHSRKGKIAPSHRGSKKEVRRNIINARFSDDEHAVIVTVAQHVGLSPATFVAKIAIAEAFGLFGSIVDDGETLRRSGGLPTNPRDARAQFDAIYEKGGGS